MALKGRPKGAKNKYNKDLKLRIEQFCSGNFEEFVYSEGSKSLVMVSADSSNFQSWAATKEKMQKVLTAYESQGFSEITLYSGGDAGNGKRFSIAEVRSWL